MSLGKAKITDNMLLKNKAKRIIESNQDISTGALIDKLVVVDELQQLNNALRRISAKYPLIKGKNDYERKQKLLNYSNIKSLVEGLEVASKEERIAKLKANLEAKKAELEKVSGKAKGLIEKEIMMLKVAIADLV